jgi:hypothetical protein
LDDEELLLPAEPEILAARQGYTDAQEDLFGTPIERRPGLPSCGWYGTSVSAERGSFALVNRGGPLEDLIGDRLKLTYGDCSTFVYVFGSDDLDYDIHITRRAFAALELLAVERIDLIVEVVAS